MKTLVMNDSNITRPVVPFSICSRIMAFSPDSHFQNLDVFTAPWYKLSVKMSLQSSSSPVGSFDMMFSRLFAVIFPAFLEQQLLVHYLGMYLFSYISPQITLSFVVRGKYPFWICWNLCICILYTYVIVSECLSLCVCVCVYCDQKVINGSPAEHTACGLFLRKTMWDGLYESSGE